MESLTDFRFLNSGFQRLNLAFPLIKDAFANLESSKCKYLSVIDPKDTYHTIKLSDNFKPCCGILSYFGSASYLYQKIPMGLSASLAILMKMKHVSHNISPLL